MAQSDDLNSNPFGVQESMEIGEGNLSLIDSIMSDDDIEDDNIPAPPSQKVEKKETVKSKTTPKEEDKEEESDPFNSQQYIENLIDGEEEEEEEEEEEVSEDDDISIIDKKEDSKKDKDVDTDEEIFSALANDLFRIGAFTKDEDEDDIVITNAQDFIERLNLEKKKGADALIEDFLSNFGQDYKDAFEAIYVKGVHPKEYFGAYNQIADFSKLDMSNEDNQILVVKRMLSDQGYDPEDIDTEIERLQNYGDLEQTSARYHKVILKRDAIALKEQSDRAEKLQNQKLQEKHQRVQNIQATIQEKAKAKEFDGIPLPGPMAKELNDFLTVDKYKNANGELLTDFDVALLKLKKPENQGLMVKVALLLKTLEKDPTLSTIQKTGITKKTDELFSEVSSKLGKKSSAKVNAQQQQAKKDKPQRWFT